MITVEVPANKGNLAFRSKHSNLKMGAIDLVVLPPSNLGPLPSILVVSFTHAPKATKYARTPIYLCGQLIPTPSTCKLFPWHRH